MSLATMTREKVYVLVEYEIRYHTPQARKDAIGALNELPISLSGVGVRGCYGCERGKVKSVVQKA
jgi:hypothetical protein